MTGDPLYGTGSSPRMRGTLVAELPLHRLDGIIPAYAGNTMDCLSRRVPYRDHPRVCGEHQFKTHESTAIQGSSPRMRGTLHVVPIREDRRGIIPAYAGNTNRQGIGIAQWRDHPRVCGEHTSANVANSNAAGSSPRMRGTLNAFILFAYRHGIIPAYAGNTAPIGMSFLYSRDHPRVCGEHITFIIISNLIPGSSPRMRGTLLLHSL